jgi:hypothetical protein
VTVAITAAAEANHGGRSAEVINEQARGRCPRLSCRRQWQQRRRRVISPMPRRRYRGRRRRNRCRRWTTWCLIPPDGGTASTQSTCTEASSTTDQSNQLLSTTATGVDGGGGGSRGTPEPTSQAVAINDEGQAAANREEDVQMAAPDCGMPQHHCTKPLYCHGA